MKYFILLCCLVLIASCYRMPNSVIYSYSPSTVDDCVSFGIRTAQRITGCGVLQKDVAPGDLVNQGEFTKFQQLKEGSAFFEKTDYYFKTAHLETGTPTLGGVACPLAIDAYNIYESRNLTGTQSIMKNSGCQVMEEGFFSLSIVDNYKDVIIPNSANAAYIKNAIVARYYEGRKWWSLD